jgi:hypothetical protein
MKVLITLTHRVKNFSGNNQKYLNYCPLKDSTPIVPSLYSPIPLMLFKKQLD